MITAGRISYYIKNRNVYVQSVNNGSTDQCGHVAVYATLEAGKTYMFSYYVTPLSDSVTGSGFDSGWFLNDQYNTFYFSEYDCILQAGKTIKCVRVITPETGGTYGLRFDTNFDGVKVVIRDIKIYVMD